MRRDWSVIKTPESMPGDDEAMAAAVALGNLFPAEVLLGIHAAFTAMDSFGGQLTVAVRRDKFDAHGNVIPREQQRDIPGQWFTTGFIFGYEQRDITLKEIKPIEDDVDLEDVDSQTDIPPIPAEEEPAEAAA